MISPALPGIESLIHRVIESTPSNPPLAFGLDHGIDPLERIHQ